MITTCTRTLAAGGWQATTTLAPPPGDLETPPLAAARPKINPSRTATHHRPDVLQDATTDATITTCTRTPATGDWQTSTTLALTAAP
ncbi:hypothetical protein [Amycolatopsis thermoflava]|uniref:hypothetical protein n=1 Tax=Amycolatopsis thermoflava TaxID=84480 RepID=UPI003EC14D31